MTIFKKQKPTGISLLLSGAMVFSMLSCEKQEIERESEDLYLVMQTEKRIARLFCNSFFQGDGMNSTKSGIETENQTIIIPSWAYNHFLSYTKSDDISWWDEMALCKELAMDNDLSPTQKKYIATIIGDISSVKDVAMSFVRMETKSLNEEDCLSIYYQQVKEAIITNVSVGATGGGAIGGGIGFELGILGGLIVSLREIKELGREYVRCVA